MFHVIFDFSNAVYALFTVYKRSTEFTIAHLKTHKVVSIDNSQ